MTRATPDVLDTERTGDATWPWRCVECESTIYHDGEFCRDCKSSPSPKRGRLGDGLREFVSWMRRESYWTFVPTVTIITGIELALTALWLQILVFGPPEFARMTAIVA